MPPDIPAPKLRPVGSEHHHMSAGHVLAGMITDGFNDRIHAAVAYCKAFAGHAVDVGLTGCRTVERDVADDDVFGGDEGRLARAAAR